MNSQHWREKNLKLEIELHTAYYKFYILETHQDFGRDLYPLRDPIYYQDGILIALYGGNWAATDDVDNYNRRLDFGLWIANGQSTKLQVGTRELTTFGPYAKRLLEALNTINCMPVDTPFRLSMKDGVASLTNISSLEELC